MEKKIFKSIYKALHFLSYFSLTEITNVVISQYLWGIGSRTYHEHQHLQIPTFQTWPSLSVALPICGFHIPGFKQLSITEDNSIYWKRKKDTFKCTSTVQTHVVQRSTMCFCVHMCIYVCGVAYVRITCEKKEVLQKILRM